MSEFDEIIETGVTVMDTAAIELQERAQIDVQIATAHKYPRVLSRVKDSMMTLATMDEDTAAACFYTLPRGGKSITGPGVRLAEIAVSSYGNLRIGTRIVSVVPDGDTPHVVVQSAMHDLEKNVAVCIEKRRRITKKKNRAAVDEDDIQLAVNACSAIAFRDAAFKVIPGALIKQVYEAARLCAVGDLKSLTAKRAAVVERLTKYGATIDRILARVGCAKIDDIGIDHLETLIGLGTALKDGNITLEDAFPAAAVPPAEGRSSFGFTGAQHPATQGDNGTPRTPEEEAVVSELFGAEA